MHDIIRFFSIFIFLMDYMVKIAYFKTSKFASSHIRDMFYMFLAARPIVITLYHVVLSVLNIQKLYLDHRRNRKEFDVDYNSVKVHPEEEKDVKDDKDG